MVEEIGGVKLNLDKYPGEDFYSEGASEDLLLELVKNNPEDEFNRVIAQNAGWSTLYHLSDLRGNIVDFLPITGKDKVLEVGAGCGAITGTLSKKAASVTCVELSKKRSLINAYRNQARDNIEIMVGNFQDIEKDLAADYDYIMLIGVFEYAASYIHDTNPYEKFLEILKSHLKEGGRLVIAIENKYGLKYLAGCREDHLGTFYSSVEGYRNAGVKTFSRNGLKKLAKNAGFKVKEYYPYPDYKLPVTIFSEDRLPLKGELSGDVPNFDNSRVRAFDEGKAYDEIIEEGLFPEVSNSFLFVLEKGYRVESFTVMNPIYSKHSNERDAVYAIRTDILADGNGKKCVVKYPINEKAYGHIEALYDYFNILSKKYENSVFTPNVCELKKDEKGCPYALFEYIEGDTLEHKLLEHINEISFTESKDYSSVYEITDAFAAAVKALPAAEIANMDLIFSNIMPKADRWTVIDYEWSLRDEVKPEFVIYRAVHYLDKASETIGQKTVFDSLDLYGRYGISEDKKKEYYHDELRLQQKIAGSRLSLIGFYSIFGQDSYDINELVRKGAGIKRIDRVKAYFDMGDGFSEANTCYYTGTNCGEDVIRVEIPVDAGCKSVRIDPTEEKCMIRINSISCKNVSGHDSIGSVLVNGTVLNNRSVFYQDADPQIIIDVTGGCESIIAEYIITTVDSRFFDEIAKAITDKNKPSMNPSSLIGRKKGPYEKIRL